MPSKPTIIVISGATASGKTAMSIALAKHFQTEIISADSRQCFKELGVAVAKPTEQELNEVPHHFINSHSIHDVVNAGVFEQYALQKATQIFQKHPIAILVGGTGLYIKAFCAGIDAMPNIPPAIRANLLVQYQANGLAWLQATVASKDPLFWQQAEQQNPHRLLRALEILEATGQSMLHFRKQQVVARPFHLIQVALDIPKPLLHQRIHQRIQQMLQQGLVAEAAALQPYQHIQALQTVGYKELFQHFNGQITLAQAIEQLNVNTRQYAKRQITWFKKDPQITWLPYHDPATIITHIHEKLALFA